MADQKRVREAPVLIRGTCVVLFVAGLLNILNQFTGYYAGYGLLYPAASVFLIIVAFASLAGVWTMEKWGFWLFAAVVAAKLVLSLYTGAFRWPELLFPVALVIFFSGYREMK
jgi:hypothetical protein